MAKRSLASFCVAIMVYCVLHASLFAQSQVTVPALQELKSAALVVRLAYAERSDFAPDAKVLIDRKMELILGATGELEAISPRLRNSDRAAFEAAIADVATFLLGQKDAAEQQVSSNLDVILIDLQAKAAPRVGMGAYLKPSRMVAVEVRVVTVRNGAKEQVPGMAIGAVTMAKQDRGCLDKRFGQLSSPSVERLFSGAYRFCAFNQNRLVGKADWIAVGGDGRPHKIVEIAVP